jgi:thiamine biosynthesis lipoprotein
MASATDRVDLSPDQASPDFRLPAGLQRDSFQAMGTTVSLLVPEQSGPLASAMVRALFWEWERTLSRFLPHSELSALNRQAGVEVTVSPLLGEVLGVALDAAWATDGFYDPTLLPQLTQLGYDRSFEAIPDLVPTLAFPPTPGGRWREISFDRTRRRVRLTPGTALDFGGIAKGMAVDAAMERLQAAGVEAALVNAGGDLAAYGLPKDEGAWPVSIAGYRGEVWLVPLRHGALATSGTARRRWRQGGERRHHLLDPRTGRPAESGLWSVSVVAARCAQAEVAAKVAFVLGPQDGAQFLHDRDLAGLLIEEGGRSHAAGTWPRQAARAR